MLDGVKVGASNFFLTPPLCLLGVANGDPRTFILAYGLQNKAKGDALSFRA